MKELCRAGKIVYFKLEESSEVDKYRIFVRKEEFKPEDKAKAAEESGGGFEFFRGLGIADYKQLFKIWLRKFPRPILLVAAENMRIISWVYIEEWFDTALDGSSAYVLRAIETVPALRGKRIGFRLLMLGLHETPGYMITKPLSEAAERFFKRAGFMEESEFRRPPVDLSKHCGYLILPPYRKQMVLKNMTEYFERL